MYRVILLSMPKNSSKESLSSLYQKKTDREHILDAPDTYIGSIVKDKQTGWFLNPTEDKVILQEVDVVPGLYKCFDEGIVNARDHYIRMSEKVKDNEKEKNPSNVDLKNVSLIDVTIDKTTGMITIMNDGDGIDIEKHPEHEIWIPEMIFGHLRTSTNYQKKQMKIVGGKNGFGFKLVLIYSLWGRIETVDHYRGLKYVQEFKDNLSIIEKPKITKCKGKPYTKVSWIPDYKRFGLESLTDDMERLFYKRCLDISAVTDKTLKVKYNGCIIGTKTFETYIDLYVGKKTEVKRIYEKANDRWEYAVCVTPTDEFCQVSFVNGIHTTKGGKHVDYILNQITKKIVEHIEKKKKIKVKPVSIKEQLMLFVNCVIENPAFDSQTKDTLNTSSSNFGSTCKVSDKFIDKICKLGIMEQALSIHDVKVDKESKKTDGKKTKSLYGITKLVDANYAGTSKSKECILILCEGDSAKAGIVSGMTKNDRNYMGVYPLKGKLMNVRDVTKTKVNDNKEISDIKKIMGLVTNKEYHTREDINSHLRYGKIVLLTDQDLDGIHIKGLCVNMFDSEWNSLLRDPSFLGFMNTPILKATKQSKQLTFYNDKEYQEWKNINNTNGWNVKYYKGLGTSTSKEFKEYFKDKRIIHFTFDDTSPDSLDKVFRKTRANDRKSWLEAYDKNNVVDTKQPTLSYKDFVDKELIHFSKYDCERSIPNLMDGLKTSQRKILYCAFKRNLVKEIKVAQFGGYVSEHSGYHHGETSLMQAVVGMAQDFMGSNNINLFMPNGQFGTRLQGGTDSASERYIFTQLNKVTRDVFSEMDDPILNYLDDDGQKVEPEFYLPIIPMILINGAVGIGTGFSTYIPSYNPIDIISRLKHILNDNNFSCLEDSKMSLVPYQRYFKGKVLVDEEDFNVIIYKGVYTVSGETLHITELPVGVWTETYKGLIEKYMETSQQNKTVGDKDKVKKSISKKTTQYIRDYQDQSTDKDVDIKITFTKGVLKQFMEENGEYGCTKLEKMMHLYTVKRTTNMHLFNEKQQLHKYKTPEDIIKAFVPIRKAYYEKRKTMQLDILKRQVLLLSNKARFIEEQCNQIIDLRNKKKSQLIDLFVSRNYDVIDNDLEYRYLRQMPIDSVLEENIIKLRKDRDTKSTEMAVLEQSTISNLWLHDLKILEKHLKSMG